MASQQTVFVGEKHSMLMVISGPVLIQNGKSAFQRAFECACDCGNKTIVAAYKLKSGRVRSCGCLISKTAHETRARIGGPLRHGHAKNGMYSKTYKTWYGMIQRCENKNHVAYKNYGGRGITVCDSWRVFDSFLSDMGERPEGKTIDRIDVDGNYEKANCRWADRFEQAANKRMNLNLNRKEN